VVKNYYVTALLGLLLLAVALLPDQLFLLALRLGALSLAAYLFYITKKIVEVERGVQRAEKIGSILKEAMKETQK